MIKSFRCAEAEKIFHRQFSRKLPQAIQRIALKKLLMLHRSQSVNDLRAPRMSKIKPVHPGEILLEEFMSPMKLSQNRLARDLSVPPRRINEIIQTKRGVTADTALRLGRYFKMSPQFWLGLQMDYDLAVEEDRISKRILRQVKVHHDQPQAA